MIRRMTLAEYRRRGFVGKPPALNTLKKMIGRGELPGEKRGNLWFVFVDEYGNPVEQRTEAQSLADTVINRWQSRRAANQ